MIYDAEMVDFLNIFSTYTGKQHIGPARYTLTFNFI